MNAHKVELEVKLTGEAYDLFIATHLAYCGAKNCIHFDMSGSRTNCELKRIVVGDNGQCKQFGNKDERPVV